MARGLVQGGTSYVLGAAAASEHSNGLAVDTAATEAAALTRDASTVAMVLTGTAGAVLMNIPPVRSALLSIALGSSVAGEAVPFSAAESKILALHTVDGPNCVCGNP